MTTLTLILSLSLSAASPPALVRVAVVDRSGSMAGERIKVVQQELRSVMKQLPPSKDAPLVIVSFSDTVHPTQVLTEPAAAEAAIAALDHPDGGTRIAPALLKAVDELARYGKSEILVLLYSDGEDADRQAILRAEDALDKLFAGRTQRGLNQSVFVKRWGGANADLVERLTERGHARVIDAGELAIEPVRIAPHLKVLAVQRDQQDPHILEIAYEGSLAISGVLKSRPTLAADCACQFPGASGDTLVRLASDVPTKPLHLKVKVPAEAERTKRLEIPFQVSAATQTAGSSYVLPLLPVSSLTLSVALPARTIVNRLSASLENVSAIGWADPLASRVRCRGEIAVTIAAGDLYTNVDRSCALTLRSPSATVTLTTPATPIDVRKPGQWRVPLTFDVSLARGEHGKPTLTESVQLELSVATAAAGVACDPPRLQLRHVGLSTPVPITTTITPSVRSVGTSRWIDLIEPLAVVDAEVAINVQGPLPHRATVTIVSPPSVRRNILSGKHSLRTGDTVLPLQVVACVKPNQRESLEFTIVPPPDTPAIHFQVVSPLRLDIKTPSQATLVNGASTAAVVHITVPDNQATLHATLLPAFRGIDLRELRSAPHIAVFSVDGLKLRSQPGVPYAPLAVELDLPVDAPPSFFQDARHTVMIQMKPVETTTAVLPGTVELVVVRQAPFRRLLTYVAWSLFPLGLLFVLVRVVRKVRDPSP